MGTAEIIVEESMMETNLLLHRNFICNMYKLNFSGGIVGIGGVSDHPLDIQKHSFPIA